MPSHSEVSQASGEYLRAQRRLANITLRELARASGVSDSYLSQVERGIYRPSAEVLKALATAFGIPAATLFEQYGLLDAAPELAPRVTVEQAIRHDEQLTGAQKNALLQVYRTFAAPPE